MYVVNSFRKNNKLNAEKRLKRSSLSAEFFKPERLLDFEPALKHPFEIELLEATL